MPKKFKGENSKAVEARVRKEAQKEYAAEQKRLKEEEEFWRDDDKHVMRKQQRKDDKEKKRLEQLERKKELQKLHDNEMDQLKGAKPQATKLTRADIEAQKERAVAATAQSDKELVHHEMPLEENVNRLQIEGDEARSVDAAISILSMKETEADRHPEKRMKSAYQKYEEENLPGLKAENPNMRLSQLKQLLKKQWMKSPENPMNQKVAAFNKK